MIITGFLQVRNEESSGNLARFLEWNLPIMDHLAAIDDASSDATPAILAQYADLLIREDFQLFSSERILRQRLLQQAQYQFPDTDWFLWLDADELLLASRSEMETLLEESSKAGFDGIELREVNLWKSTRFERLDSGFGHFRAVRFWKNSPNLHFDILPGLHREMHPSGISRIRRVHDLEVLHFGFYTEAAIQERFDRYRRLGQTGRALWRLVHEQALEVRELTQSRLGERSGEYLQRTHPEAPPAPVGIIDRWWKSHLQPLSDASSETPPLVTIVCLIYQGLDWLEFIYGEMLLLQSELGAPLVELLVVANNATPEVLSFLRENGIPHVVAPTAPQGEWYINSVYRAYTFGAEMASGEYVLFINSDMAFAPGFLAELIARRDPDLFLCGRLVESGVLRPGALAVQRDFGTCPRDFKRGSFRRFAQTISSPDVVDGGLYMPSLIHRQRFLEIGGFPAGNLTPHSVEGYIHSGDYEAARPGEELVPGDQAFISRAENFGMRHRTVMAAIAYHFQEGEKRSSGGASPASGIVIANDQIRGILGEPTLWGDLVETLEAAGIRVRAFEQRATRFIPASSSLWRHTRTSKPRVVFQNATYLPLMAGPWRTGVLTQDAPTSRRTRGIQRWVRRRAQFELTNSSLFISDSVGPDRQMLLPLPLSVNWDTPLRARQHGTDTVHAVFVGAFNEVKGWKAVRRLVYSHPEIKFSLVSKYPGDDHGLPTDEGPNWKVLRCLDQTRLRSVLESADVFILGSPFETQCLAAIEAVACGLLVVMPPTGLLASAPDHLRRRIGVFTEDLQAGLDEACARIKSGDYMDVQLDELGLDRTLLLEQWRSSLLQELANSFLPSQRRRRPPLISRPLRAAAIAIRDRGPGLAARVPRCVRILIARLLHI